MLTEETSAQQVAEPIDFPTQKQQLEIVKLNEEIKELRKKWYRKPAYLAALLPTFIGTVSLIVLFFNGNFSSKAESLKLESDKLSYRIQKFQDSSRIYEIQKDSLRNLAKHYQDSINKVVQLAVKNQKETDSVKKELQSVISKIKNANSQQQKEQVTASVLQLVDKLKNQIDYLENVIAEKENKLKTLMSLRDLQEAKERYFIYKIKALDYLLDSLKAINYRLRN